MDAENLKKRLQQYTFRENNGRILRTVNILNPRESTVGNICYLMQGEPWEAVQNSLNYLTEAGVHPHHRPQRRIIPRPA